MDLILLRDKTLEPVSRVGNNVRKQQLVSQVTIKLCKSKMVVEKPS